MEANQWANLCIADKNGKHFKVTASPMSVNSEIRNLQYHLKQATKHPRLYQFLDIETAEILVDDKPYKV